jgi:hypothetical protein
MRKHVKKRLIKFALEFTIPAFLLVLGLIYLNPEPIEAAAGVIFIITLLLLT